MSQGHGADSTGFMTISAKPRVRRFDRRYVWTIAK